MARDTAISVADPVADEAPVDVAYVAIGDEDILGHRGSLHIPETTGAVLVERGRDPKNATARRKLIIASAICVSLASRSKQNKICYVDFQGVFMLLEIVAGYFANSLALVTDAAHLLSDLSSFLISLFAIYVSELPGTQGMSFGYHRAEILGAVTSVLLIWFLTLFLVGQALHRIVNPPPVDGPIMFSVAFFGTLANLAMTAILGMHSHGIGGLGGNSTCSHSHSHGHSHSHEHGHNHHHGHQATTGQRLQPHNPDHGKIGKVVSNPEPYYSKPPLADIKDEGDPSNILSLPQSPTTTAASGGEGPVEVNYGSNRTRCATEESRFEKARNSFDSTMTGPITTTAESRLETGLVKPGTGIDSSFYAVSQEHGAKEPASSMNLRAAYIHAVGDLIQNVGVLIAAGCIWYEPKWSIADPICTFIFSALVCWTTVSMIREAVNVLMEGAPQGLHTGELRADLKNIRSVIEVHDLHVWSLSVGRPSLACHIVIEEEAEARRVLRQATRLCQEKYGILHTTVQIDFSANKIACETDAHAKCH